ncbi:MAG TPA: CPBP family intramembrane glutamic endopeptidase [Streptosporangiaceae bacterium]|nr:CPBP family intramembrane glutamic endopeptidase [Streptosporangiaceae bacterium]
MSTDQPQATWPGPIGRPARPHWWSIQPVPPSSPISARRAYAEVLGVFALFFAAGILAGAETLVKHYPAPTGSWAVFTPAAISELASAALAVVVTTALSARRGISPRSLGLGLPRAASGGAAIGPAFRQGVWAIAALIAGGIVTGQLETGHLPQPAHASLAYLLYATADSVAAGVVEETVVLAFVVTTLRQAGRPLPEIVIVAVLLRCSYHDYYGPGVVGIAIWASVFVWLFLRTGSVIPLIVVHVGWDTAIFLAQRWHAIRTGEAIFVLLVIVAAAISWLAEVSRRNPPGGLSAPRYTAWPEEPFGRSSSGP